MKFGLNYNSETVQHRHTMKFKYDVVSSYVFYGMVTLRMTVHDDKHPNHPYFSILWPIILSERGKHKFKFGKEIDRDVY